MADQRERTLVLLDGANELSGPRAAWWVVRHWPALRRELCGAPGYVAHRAWYAPPWTIGLLTWWEDERSAYRFAHLPVHRQFWAWAAEPGRSTGGWLATYSYVRGGPYWGNGVRSLARRFAGHVPEPTGTPPAPPPPLPRSAR